MMEQQAVKKRIDKEKIDRDYYNGGSTLDAATTSQDYGSPSGRNKYKERIDRMLSTQQSPLSTGRKMPGISKVTFYQRNNRSMLAERGLTTLSKEPYKSEDLRSTTISKITERQMKARQNLESLAQRDA